MARRELPYERLDALVRADRNPKGHVDEEINESILQHGFVEPPLIDERTGQIVGGHGRYDSLLRLMESGAPLPDGCDVDDDGMWLLPVVRGWASRDDDDALRMAITLNRLVERGGWVRERLYEDLSTLAERGAMPVGFKPADLDALRSLTGAGPDLGRLSRELGPPDETEFWPEIKLKVAPTVRLRWDEVWERVNALVEDESPSASTVLDALLDRLVLDE